MGRRFLGVPWLWAVAHSAIAFSIYYALGVVADRGLGLTPVIFGIAGLVYVVTTMTYVEGGAMFNERGGSNTLARHAFNELVSFIAGWAILIDYVIVIALAAITVPHYLAPISGRSRGRERGGAGRRGRRRARRGGQHRRVHRQPPAGLLVALTSADLLLQFLLIVVGLIVVWDPAALTAELDLFTSPGVERHRLGAGHLDGRAGGDRGRIRPRPRPRLATRGPAARAACRQHRRSRSSTSGWRSSR